MNTRILLALVAGMSASCGSPTIDLNAARASLRQAVEEYHRAADASDADALMALYASSGVMLPPDDEDQEGLTAIRQHVIGFTSLENFTFDGGTPTVVVSNGGRMGYSVAEVNLSWTVNGERMTDRLRDVHIWTRGQDGVWKLVVDVWNGMAPDPG